MVPGHETERHVRGRDVLAGQLGSHVAQKASANRLGAHATEPIPKVLKPRLPSYRRFLCSGPQGRKAGVVRGSF